MRARSGQCASEFGIIETRVWREASKEDFTVVVCVSVHE